MKSRDPLAAAAALGADELLQGGGAPRREAERDDVLYYGAEYKPVLAEEPD